MNENNNAAVSTANSSSEGSAGGEIKTETLVVVSKVKGFIRQNGQMNTSQCCIDAITQKVARELMAAIESARSAGRKTVMGKDIR